MKELQKERILSMRQTGHGYGAIAKNLGLSENTVKSFCKRNNPNGNTGIQAVCSPTFPKKCVNCGNALVQASGHRVRKYCSDACRMKWWNSHPMEMNKRNLRTFVCQECGKSFQNRGKRERKYCSRSCSGKSRAARP